MNSVSPPTTNPIEATTVTKETTEIDELFLVNGYKGEISYPSTSSSNYANNKDLTWIISGPELGTVSLSFTRMDIETNLGCRYDFVEIRDGKDADAPFLGRFCGKKIPDVVMVSTTNHVRVKFHSDASTSGKGFALDWRWREKQNQYISSAPITTSSAPVLTTKNPFSGNFSFQFRR